MKRNHALRETQDKLKKSAQGIGKSVQIVWQTDGKKDKTREVQIDGVVAFRQTIDDLNGIYVVPFAGIV